MALNALQIFRLEQYKRELGELTSSEALELAIEAETIAKNLGPFDVAVDKFYRDTRILSEYAYLLECIGK